MSIDNLNGNENQVSFGTIFIRNIQLGGRSRSYDCLRVGFPIFIPFCYDIARLVDNIVPAQAVLVFLSSELTLRLAVHE